MPYDTKITPHPTSSCTVALLLTGPEIGTLGHAQARLRSMRARGRSGGDSDDGGDGGGDGGGTDGSVSVYNNTTDSTPSEHALAVQSSVFSKVTEAAARYERKRMKQLQNIHSAFFNAIATNSPHLRVMDGRGGCQLLYGHTDVVLSLQGTPDG
tara:strand:- start:131 stop:592 length:462 start_codon:yes stop_codon:yes gene_type:complete